MNIVLGGHGWQEPFLGKKCWVLWDLKNAKKNIL